MRTTLYGPQGHPIWAHVLGDGQPPLFGWDGVASVCGVERGTDPAFLMPSEVRKAPDGSLAVTPLGFAVAAAMCPYRGYAQTLACWIVNHALPSLQPAVSVPVERPCSPDPYC